MSNNSAPDSWEAQADTVSGNNSPTQATDVSTKFSTLNVNAEVFVPSFARSTVIAEDENSPTKSTSSENSDTHGPLLNGTCFFLSATMLPIHTSKLNLGYAIPYRKVIACTCISDVVLKTCDYVYRN